MADKQPSQLDIVKAQTQDLVDAGKEMFGADTSGFQPSGYRGFSNIQNTLGTSAPGDVVRQDFSSLNQQAREGVPGGLTPQETNLYQHHLRNAMQGGYVQQSPDSVSTIYNTTAEIGGKTYVIPTIWEGKVVPPGSAIERAKQIGIDKFPSYSSEQQANQRYMNELHPMMEKDIKPLLQIISYLKSKGMM